MAKLDVEAVDLKELTDLVRDATEYTPLTGAVSGRSYVRDLVAENLECSLLEAEELVDTMISRGWARLVRDEDGREVWRLERGA